MPGSETRRIPALVLIGPENSGKTTIHEAIAKLLPRGAYLASTSFDELLSAAHNQGLTLAALDRGSQPFGWWQTNQQVLKDMLNRRDEAPAMERLCWL